MVVKVKTWIEDDSEHLIFGGGKTQVLELIDETGSISEASKKVGMNYKKAWTHIKILQEYIEDDLVVVNKGRESGGTTLTPKAKELILKYKQLEAEVKAYSTKRFQEIFIADGNVIHCTKDKQDV
ncbi:ModE repressor domain protein C-terminal part [Sulfurimonas gotlandica GD1]|jgi:molybdate transport repressor ModE-like protein|uniref:ModE repressor domain protein C-terminal part n=1 Tax=Sulfurimonas gotlandica (strain DSM 19862 / JCM 16533 / GD1) TaxID=929558 RepID=B6BLJ5_SULGG|nr:LysR family transcriptional regulator [Sulfurimonas gotlandica]EDZ62026.1 ModE repressor domain protein [Sulfurimonas gotlandica GD1]EHP28652.1 ModE repressor domain protein C-terminal part [Sulfurimonas gotlandica GD1]